MRIFTFFTAIILCQALLAGSGWKVEELVEVNGMKVKKTSYLDNDVIRVVDRSEKAGHEMEIDLKNNSITTVNHVKRGFQKRNLEHYLGFLARMTESLGAKRTENVTFHKEKGSETVGSWKSVPYLVRIDGRDFMKVWVAEAGKLGELVALRERFASLIPAHLLKYRSVEDKIRDRFNKLGIIVKMHRYSRRKLPPVTQTLISVEEVKTERHRLVIPKDYKKHAEKKEGK